MPLVSGMSPAVIAIVRVLSAETGGVPSSNDARNTDRSKGRVAARIRVLKWEQAVIAVSCLRGV
jgi:hypothetical protein